MTLCKLSPCRGGEVIFRFLLWGSLLVFPWMSFAFGTTVDEPLGHAYGLHIWNYYATGFKDQSAKSFLNWYYYGGLFEVLSVAGVKLAAAFGLNNHFQDMFEVRHLFNGFFGWIALVFTGLIARRLYGVYAGVLAIILLLLTPRFLGHTFNNPRDIPFAAMFTAGLYVLSGIRRGYPYFQLWSIVALSVATGLAMAVRIGGLLLICYTAILLGWNMFLSKRDLDARKFVSVFCCFVLGTLLALCINAVFSPWQLENPILRPFEALKIMSNFVDGYPDRVVYDGAVIDHTDLPWHFLPNWFLIATPVAVLVGFGLSVAFAWGSWRRSATGIFFFSVLFPVAYVLAKHTPLYHDLRHFLFLVPPMTVLSAAGFLGAYRFCAARVKSLRYLQAFSALAVTCLAVSLWDPLSFSVRNHPREAVYFNQLTGGYHGAFYLYELDYWMTARKQAVEWIRKMEAFNGKGIEQYDLVNLNKWPDDRRKALKDPTVVHAIFIGDDPVMLVRYKSQK